MIEYMNFEPTRSQAELLDKVKTWFTNYEKGIYIGDHPQWFSYSGAAGVGKGVSARMIVDMLNLDSNSYVACAYVGKAVLQLLKNGMNAKTIHSLIYDMVPYFEKSEKSERKIMKWQFILKNKLDKDYRLIFVDEAAMVNDDMRDELLSFGIPIIFMGDMNQLPPVFGSSTVLSRPDHILTEIMRQKENDPIVILSQMVLKGIPILEGVYGESSVVDEIELDRRIITDYDQILCNTNKYRVVLNHHIRENLKNYPKNKPMIGDKLICCQNNWEIMIDGYALTNGMLGYITDINRLTAHKGYYLIDFQPDFLEDDKQFINLKMDKHYINMPYELQKNFGKIENEKFDYGYAITVYKSQGSEFDRVLYFDSFFRSEELTKKSRYTAITRAKKKLTIVLNNRNIRKLM